MRFCHFVHDTDKGVPSQERKTKTTRSDSWFEPASF